MLGRFFVLNTEDRDNLNVEYYYSDVLMRKI